jgi:hypothetical protein
MPVDDVSAPRATFSGRFSGDHAWPVFGDHRGGRKALARSAARKAKPPARPLLAVCDDRPARWADIFGYVAQAAAAAPPAPGGQLGSPALRVRNARAREVLEWAPRYPDSAAPRSVTAARQRYCFGGVNSQ